MATEKLSIAIEDAVQEFEQNQQGFDESANYYNATERDMAVGIATPPPLRSLLAQVGVPRIYVNALAERLIIEGFRLGEASEGDEELWSWFKANGLDNLTFLAFIDALVYGRSYITVSAPGEGLEEGNPFQIEGVPIIRVESPLSLYAKVDPRTRIVEWAVRVVKDENGDTVAATMYYKDRTELYVSENGILKVTETVNHGLGAVPVVPMIHSGDSVDLHGVSAITPEVRSITDAMSRAMMNMQTTSELMATPQRIIFGSTVDEINEEGKSGLELYTSSYIAVEDPQGKAIQLPAAELRNFTEAISHMLKMAAAYTGLPPQYLSYSNDNPASAEAIRSSEARLVRTCESLCAMFGSAWEQAMRMAKLVMGQQLTIDDFRMETVWRDPGTPTYQAKADAVTKLYANGNGIIPLEQARIDMGYTPEQRRQMEEWDKNSPLSQMASLYPDGSPFGGVEPEEEVNEPEAADDGDAPVGD